VCRLALLVRVQEHFKKSKEVVKQFLILLSPKGSRAISVGIATGYGLATVGSDFESW
jgi:hypothetical protein